MVAGMDEVLRQAIEAAERSFRDGEWGRLSPAERTAAIYREMRRIDAERTREYKKNAAKSQPESKRAP